MASPWWARHAQSFAARQRDAYERSGSLGWSFGAWKFDEATETAMHPAVLAQRSLRAASQAGWLPDLSAKPALPPCLKAPAADFALGDATAPPSAAPPPPPPPVPQDWPVEAAAPSGRVAAALGGFGCGALLMMMVAMASRKRGAAADTRPSRLSILESVRFMHARYGVGCLSAAGACGVLGCL